MAFKRSGVRLPLSPPASTEFEHHKDGIYFRQWCCGLCGIQVKKKHKVKRLVLFLLSKQRTTFGIRLYICCICTYKQRSNRGMNL